MYVKHLRPVSNVVLLLSLKSVRVKGGMSLRNDMQNELRNGVIMTEECNLFRMKINYALSEILEQFQRKACSNVLETFGIFRTVKQFRKVFRFYS